MGMKGFLYVRLSETQSNWPFTERIQNHPSALNHAAYYRTYHGAAYRLPVWQACHLSEVPGKISGYSDLIFLENPNSFHSGTDHPGEAFPRYFRNTESCCGRADGKR